MAALSDPAAAFRAGCARGEFLVQKCADCDHVQFPPRACCLACGSQDLLWHAASHTGTIHSFSIVHRAPTEAFRSRVPYALALIDLSDGGRAMMNIDTPDLDALAIGQSVTIAFRTDGERTLPVARPA